MLDQQSFNETVIQAIRRDDKNEIGKLSIDFNAVDKDGWNLLHYAAKFGSLEVIKFLVDEKGIGVDIKTGDQNESIHIC